MTGYVISTTTYITFNTKIYFVLHYDTHEFYMLNLGTAVSQWNPETAVNPEELGEYAQGDILFRSNNESLSRNGLKAASARWPKGVIPYEISPYFRK